MSQDDRYKKLKLNAICSLLYQLITLISGFILPKLFLDFYGSEVNGLVSSITQFLSFITICDLGISAIVSASLYGPLANKDINLVSKIYKFTKIFFRIIGGILVAYIILLVFLIPQVTVNSFDWFFTASLVISISISHLAQYLFGASAQLLLNADQKSYVSLIINSITLFLNTVCSVIIICLGGSIQLVKLLASCIYLLRPVVLAVYVRRNYKIDSSVKYEKGIVKQKGSGIIQHLSYMIYENTDIIVLTLLSTLTNVSIYSVYFLVVSSVKRIILAIYAGFQALFGNMIASSENDKLQDTYNLYFWSTNTLVSTLYTLVGILIVPFVLLYTQGVADANYNVPTFAALITVSFGFSCVRDNLFSLIRAAGHFRETRNATLIEMFLNLLISIVLVYRLGLVGVAIGTLASSVFFVVYEFIYFSKNIVFYSLKKVLKQVLVNCISVFAILFSTCWINIDYSVWSWLLNAAIASSIALIICIAIQFIFYRKEVAVIINAFKRKFGKNKTV